MAVYCFECGVEVPKFREILRNGRVFCSTAHSRTTRQTAVPPKIKQAAQPAPAQTVGGPKPTEAAKPEIKQAAQPAPVQTVGGPKPTEPAKPVATKPPSA
jgi:uncharacterized Zn finger protein (UPF0148 family)